MIVDFGDPYGIWIVTNGTAWSQLHPMSSTKLLTGDLDGNGRADVIVDFGAAGLWAFANNTTWTLLYERKCQFGCCGSHAVTSQSF